jgi:uncharacterized protein (UPF0332 family)
VTPGQVEEARAELDRAERALEEARLLLGAGSLEGTTSRMYYAVFHATRAALLIGGRSSRTHSGQISLFIEAHGEAPVLGRLLELRARADYEFGDFPASAEALTQLLGDAESFLRRCTDNVGEAAARGADQPDPPPDY